MFTHTKTEVDCSPGASTEVVKKEKKATDHASGKRKEQKKQKKKQTNQAQPRRHLDCYGLCPQAQAQRHHARLVRQGR
jgi:hypothetical protein